MPTLTVREVPIATGERRGQTASMSNWDAWEGAWSDAPDLWENQGGEPVLGDLEAAIDDLRAYRQEWLGLPVRVALFDGVTTRVVNVMEIGLDGGGAVPTAVVITVVLHG